MKSLGKKQQARLPKIRQIVVLGLVLAGVVYVAGGPLASAGVAVGLPISVLNYHMMVGAVDSASVTAAKAQSFFMRRFLWRTLITFTALFLSLLGGIPFMLGMALALSLQVMVHFLEGFGLILKRKG